MPSTSRRRNGDVCLRSPRADASNFECRGLAKLRAFDYFENVNSLSIFCQFSLVLKSVLRTHFTKPYQIGNACSTYFSAGQFDFKMNNYFFLIIETGQSTAESRFWYEMQYQWHLKVIGDSVTSLLKNTIFQFLNFYLPTIFRLRSHLQCPERSLDGIDEC